MAQWVKCPSPDFHCGIKLESNSKLAIGPTTWMKLNCIILSESSKVQKTTCGMVYRDQNLTTICQGLTLSAEVDYKGTSGNSGSDETLFLYLYIFVYLMSCGYPMIVCICQNSKNCTLRSINLLYVNYTLNF